MVEVLMAGTPCQGFSLLNLQYKSERSLLNDLNVLSFLSYIDYYRPLYVVFENVP